MTFKIFFFFFFFALNTYLNFHKKNNSKPNQQKIFDKVLNLKID